MVLQQVKDRISIARYCRQQGAQGLIPLVCRDGTEFLIVLGLGGGDIRCLNQEQPYVSDAGSKLFIVNRVGNHAIIDPLYRNA